MGSITAAQRLLGHRDQATTDIYLRQRSGESVTPVLREIRRK
jgi:site-specific recombinase XerD